MSAIDDNFRHIFVESRALFENLNFDGHHVEILPHSRRLNIFIWRAASAPTTAEEIAAFIGMPVPEQARESKTWARGLGEERKFGFDTIILFRMSM